MTKRCQSVVLTLNRKRGNQGEFDAGWHPAKANNVFSDKEHPFSVNTKPERCK